MNGIPGNLISVNIILEGGNDNQDSAEWEKELLLSTLKSDPDMPFFDTDVPYPL